MNQVDLLRWKRQKSMISSEDHHSLLWTLFRRKVELPDDLRELYEELRLDEQIRVRWLGMFE